MNRTLPLYLAVNATLFAAFAVGAIAMPTVLAGPLDIALPTPTALADFRAVYGGLSFGITLFSVMALKRPEFRLPVLWLLVLCMDGLILGRLVSTIVSGPGSLLVFAQLGLEVVSAAWGFALIRAQAAQPTRGTASPLGFGDV
jgi:hypothetical protein